MSERYKRLEQIGWIPELLGSSTALVIGAGALGNEVLKNLALIGFGKVLVIDMDTIEEHNLTRSVLFRYEDAELNHKKSEMAAKRAMEIDQNCEVRWFHGEVQSTLGLGVFRRVDLVFGCLDNIKTRIDVCNSCMIAGVPYIDGGLRGIDGRIKVFAPPFDVCFDCTLTEEARMEEEKRWSCLGVRDRAEDVRRPSGPTAPTSSSLTAAIQVQIGLKILHHNYDPILYQNYQLPINRVIDYYGYRDESDNMALPLNTECPSHIWLAEIPDDWIRSIPKPSSEITVQELLLIARSIPGMENASIELGFDLVHGLINESDKVEDVLRRKHAFYIDELIDWTASKNLKCENCGHDLTEEYMPEGILQLFSVDCPKCNREENKLILKKMEISTQIGDQDDLLHRTIAELFVPIGDILVAKKWNLETDSIAYAALEFTEDFPEIFGDAIPAPRPMGRISRLPEHLGKTI